MYGKVKGQSYYKNRHSCFLLQYHMVLVTKYRHPVLTGAVKDLIYQTIRDIFTEKGLVILKMNGEPVHIHILYESDPFTSPGGLANIVKTKTSRFARKNYGDTLLKQYYWKPLFWSDSYFVSTVSENSLSAVQEYAASSEEEATLEGFLEQVALVSDLDETPMESEAVTLMTIHSAKGLEFPVVFLAGMEENLFPHIRAVNEGPEQVEEEL